MLTKKSGLAITGSKAADSKDTAKKWFAANLNNRDAGADEKMVKNW